MVPIVCRYCPLRAFAAIYLLALAGVWALFQASALVWHAPPWQAQMAFALFVFGVTVDRVSRGRVLPLMRFEGSSDIARVLDLRHRSQHFAAAFTLIAAWVLSIAAMVHIHLAEGDPLSFSALWLLALTLLHFAIAWVVIHRAVGNHEAVKHALEQSVTDS